MCYLSCTLELLAMKTKPEKTFSPGKDWIHPFMLWRGYINTLKIEPTLSFEFFVVVAGSS